MRLNADQLLLVFLAFCAMIGIAQSELIVGEAKVQVMSRRIKRSTETDKVQQEYDVKVSAFGVTHDLKLQPAASVFESNFRYQEIRVNDIGETIWTDITPTRDVIRALEEKLFVDASKNTVVHLDDVHGEFTLNGIVNDAKIRTRRQISEVVLPRENIVIHQAPVDGSKDYILNDEEDIEAGQRSGMDENTKLMLEPELAFVIDYELSKNFTEPELMEYMAIMVNSMNNKYSLTNTDKLSIVCKFVGLNAIRSEAAQPFVKAGHVGRGQHNLTIVLANFGRWALANQKMLGQFDISPLQLGVEFNEKGLRGLAPTPGACDFRKNLATGPASSATPCSQDLGSYWGGAFTLTHELAHNLGTPHDGEVEMGTEACPWKAGFIMSYLGWGTTDHFKLSTCSLAKIREYAMTNKAKCLFEKSGAKIKHTSKLTPGDVVDSLKICTYYGYGTPVVSGRTPDDTCRNTLCLIKRDGGGEAVVTTNSPPGNGAPCGKTGKCSNGWCISQGPAFTLKEICMGLHNNSEFYPIPGNDICSTGRIKCRASSKTGHSDLDGTGLMTSPGTPCADKSVCLNKKCTQLDSPDAQTPQAKCVIKTGKVEADLGPIVTSPTNICLMYSTCKYATEFEPFVDMPLSGIKCTPPSGGSGGCSVGVCKEFRDLTAKEQCRVETGDPAADGAEDDCAILCTVGGKKVKSLTESKTGLACKKGTESGSCVKDACVPEMKVPFPPVKSSDKKMSLNTACEKLTGTSGALVRETSQDDACKSLTCTKPTGEIVSANTNTPDGTKCGPLMRCRAGTCKVCGTGG